ncbi:MAG: formate dehydrogenase accessory sulfurtransferase FdhD [Desulfobacula sp.]|uniref:formate dehydrogenase accessory sulfurtransferase FdhD n=1 Tax=Desulfobacula sp. TaxID=2593537 RepID=UPI0025C3E602|nr:formate dehydrogenase accessory sulfurtransferase FdhD [Desulfobacula sp.]MCD4720869.1 formate dehydrogenase accessory sulfurtransferase FdhD [Desulfobacula sp.]
MDSRHIIKKVEITRIKDNKKFLMKDSIIDEDILEIIINRNKTFQMVFSMTHPKELAVGFLFTQGIVHKKAEIEAIEFFKDKKQCHVTLNDQALKRLNKFKKDRLIKGSSGGALLQDPGDLFSSRPEDHFSITYDQVLTLIQLHWDHSELFHKTGAVHSAGLCDPSNILSYYEDIGRHNALDKLAGDILLKEMDTQNKIATLSCRMSLEIIGKIIKTGIPIAISNTAPTLSAVKLANRTGLTIVGFARNNRFNIYTHEKRIKADHLGS